MIFFPTVTKKKKTSSTYCKPPGHKSLLPRVSPPLTLGNTKKYLTYILGILYFISKHIMHIMLIAYVNEYRRET